MRDARGLRVAIVGAGPAGAALATLLTLDGHDVVLFDDERRPELVVGESLIPAGIPSLRRLGIEDAVATIGMRKPGATLTWSPSHRFAFRFARYQAWMVPYAYNVPRREFDQVLLARAEEVGARRVTMRAAFERGPGGDGTGADARARDAVAATGWPAPDLVVDATGRARSSARLLEIPGHAGPAQRRRPLRPLRGLHVGRRAGPGADRSPRRRMELAHPAERAALRRRGPESRHRRAPRRHAGSTPRRRDRRRPRARRHVQDARQVTGVADLQQLPADLDARHRPAVGPRWATPSASSIPCCRPA